MMEDVTIKIGQIWKEVDPRIERYARVIEIRTWKGSYLVKIRTVHKTHGDWAFKKHSRETYCDRNRFNGKRGGYELYEDSP